MASSKTKRPPATPTTKLNSILQQDKAQQEIVLKEFPVFLSKTLMKQLCLIQYPQRPGNISTQKLDVLHTKIKPRQKKIQMTIGMDPDSELYDPETGELLAEAAEGIGLDEDKYMPDHDLRLDKMTLESTTIPKLSDNYAIGIVRRGQVTLTPISSIVQMKTIYPYLNKAEKAKAAYQKEKSGVDTEDEEEEATKVTVKFSRNTASAGDKGTSSSTFQRPMSSYMARKREEEEAWVDLEYVAEDSAEYDKLYTTKPNSPFYVLDRKEYLETLFPKHVDTCIDGVSWPPPAGEGGKTMTTTAGDEKEKDKPQKVNNIQKISVQAMKALPTIHDQLRVLLSNAKVLQFYQIVDFLRTKLKADFDDTSLVRSVQTVAILVQGCWVVKSDVIYPDEFKSSANGISGPFMQRGRDTILSQFTEHRFVKRTQMITLTKLPSEEVTEMLTQISVMIPKKGWEFILPYDTNFLGRFPEVVERQSLVWQMKKNQLIHHRVRHSSTSEGGAGSSSPSSSPPRRRSRNKSISSSGEDSSGGDSDHQSGGHGSRRRRQSDSTVGGSGDRTSRRQRRSSTRSEVGIPSRVEM